jgi:uncharacterized membrane protein
MFNKIINIKILFISLLILITLDFIYLYFNQNWYKNEIKKSQGSELILKWSGVLIRYLSQTFGLNLFVLQHNGTIIDSFIYGIIIYSNYLGTNYATIDTFDEKLAMVDLLKGGIIMSLTTYLTYKLTYKLTYN